MRKSERRGPSMRSQSEHQEKKWKLTFTKSKDRGKLDRPKARAVIIMLRYFYCKCFLIDPAFVWIWVLGWDTIFQERVFITFYITSVYSVAPYTFSPFFLALFYFTTNNYYCSHCSLRGVFSFVSSKIRCLFGVGRCIEINLLSSYKFSKHFLSFSRVTWRSSGLVYSMIFYTALNSSLVFIKIDFKKAILRKTKRLFCSL